jgi:predicted RNase H-like HicB family nuclease
MCTIKGAALARGIISAVKLSIELEREDDGHWIAEALEIPGVMSYGSTREEAIGNTERLAIEVIADCVAHGASCSGRPSTDRLRPRIYEWVYPSLLLERSFSPRTNFLSQSGHHTQFLVAANR